MRKLLGLGVIALVVFTLFITGIPLGTKQATARSGEATFDYAVTQRLRLTAQGVQLQLDMHSDDLVAYLDADFAAKDIHRKLRDQRVDDLVFTSPHTAQITGRAVLRLNKYLKSKLQFTGDMRITHEDRALVVIYAIDFKDFPDALERDVTRRIPMDKRLRRDCMVIDNVTLVQGSRHRIRVAATCQWGQMF